MMTKLNDVERDGDMPFSDTAGNVGTSSRSYLPYTEDPSATLTEVPENDGRPADERIDELFERMRASRRVLRGLIAYCREGRTADEVADEVQRLQEGTFSVYDAPALCALLQRSGALKKMGAERVEPRVVEENGVQYLQPAPVEEVAERWVSTAEGLAYLGHADDLRRFWDLVESDARYEHIYRIILDCCATEKGASVRQLSDAVDDDPEVQEPRLYAQYFLDGLAECNLVEWAGAWIVTDLGRRAIEELDAREATC